MLQMLNRLINRAATIAYGFRRRPDGTSGAHGIALTPDRKIILVRLRYAPGWRLPGGGRSKDEGLEDAVLRELQEEIGMRSHGKVRRSLIAGVLIVEDVVYRPRKWSWEVEAICEAAIDDLPPDAARRTRDWIETARGAL
jgi:ADP-ribose pyrophosphatase YjhB (NUDIX family)